MKKLVAIFMVLLMAALLFIPANSEVFGKNNTVQDVNLDVAITTDWVNDYQDHGLRIREFALNQTVYAYIEVSGDDLYGINITQVWWYNNGTGLEKKWDYTYTVPQHWSSCGTWTWWAIGLDYGRGTGYIEVLIDGEHLGQTNWYAIDNNKPSTPSISGPTEGKIRKEYEYTFTATDDTFDSVSYFVDWGDGTTSGWTDYVSSGTEVKLTHTWQEKGTYIIKCKVRDLAYNESDWATSQVNMPVVYEHPVTLLEKIFNWLQYLLGRENWLMYLLGGGMVRNI